MDMGRGDSSFFEDSTVMMKDMRERIAARKIF